MRPMEYVRRYAVFLFSIFVATLGVILVIKCELGTGPQVSLVYVLSRAFPSISLGTFTILQNLAFILGQILLLRRRYKPVQLLQIPMSLLIGLVTDGMMPLLAFVQPRSYPARLAILLLGCCCIATSVALAVRANVLMNSSEALARGFSVVTGRSFSTWKVVLDCTVVACAVAVSLVTMGTVEGVREGTVISALAVGNIARLIIPRLDWLDRWMSTGKLQKLNNAD